MIYELDQAEDVLPVDSSVRDIAVPFVRRYRWHKGIYVLKDDTPDGTIDRIERITFKIPKHDRFLDENFGKHIGDVDPRSLKRHSHRGDGAIALNYEGIVLDDHRYVREMKPEKLNAEFMTGVGAGHLSMASATVDYPVTAFICSAEKGTIKVVKNGNQVRELFYKRPYFSLMDLPYETFDLGERLFEYVFSR